MAQPETSGGHRGPKFTGVSPGLACLVLTSSWVDGPTYKESWSRKDIADRSHSEVVRFAMCLASGVSKSFTPTDRQKIRNSIH